MNAGMRGSGAGAADLPEPLRAILDAPYPRFSRAEMRRRRAALAEAGARTGVDALLVCGEQRAGGGVGWLTGWPVTAEAVAVLDVRDGTGRPDVLLVQYHNHVPLARRLAPDCEVRWGGASTLDAVEAELAARGAKRAGVIGPLGAGKQRRLAAAHEVVDLNAAYTALRLLKSEEEIDWVRIGAWLSDRAVEALRREVRAGISERELWRICENAYLGDGGATWIHYFGATPMDAPDCCVPAQYPSTRRIARGDAVFTEISAQFWDYPGQVLRTFAVGAPPTPLYRDLHDTAEAAFAAMLSVVKDGAHADELLEAARLIEAAGFVTCDDLVHGFVGGYLPPVLVGPGRPGVPRVDFTLRAGMTLVVQPNVVTADGKAGVQVGELVLVTRGGFERLHRAPRDFAVVGA